MIHPQSVREQSAAEPYKAIAVAATSARQFPLADSVWRAISGTCPAVLPWSQGSRGPGQCILVYLVHVMTRKSFGLMTRKLSVTNHKGPPNSPEPFHAEN